MNILYFIGNGFDLAYGLKTRYTDFYGEFVKPSPDDTEDVKKLKAEIGRDYANWSDLEKAIGEYTANYSSGTLLEETFYSLKDSLQNYLAEIDKQFTPGDGTISIANRAIVNPENMLEEADLVPFQRYNKIISSRNGDARTIDVVTFNYTHSFEKLIGGNYPVTYSLGHKVRQLRHLHGDLKDTILMGVNDSSQITNAKLRTNEDLMEVLVKPEANDAMRNLSNSQVESLIKSANVIVLYGLSLGETDRKWWEIIGKQYARDDFRLMYFYFDPKAISSRRKELTRRIYRRCVNEIITKFNIKADLQDKVEPKSFVAINKVLFGK